MIGRIIGLLTIPLMAITIWGLIRQVRKEQRLRSSTPIVGLVMAPITLIINIIFLHKAFSAFVGPMLLIVGLGFGLAWGQTNRLFLKNGDLMGKRSYLHLIFWGISYALTQFLASFAPAYIVVGGLSAMFFSTGSTLGTNFNLLVRQRRMLTSRQSSADSDTSDVIKPPGLPEIEKMSQTQMNNLPAKSEKQFPSLPQ